MSNKYVYHRKHVIEGNITAYSAISVLTAALYTSSMAAYLILQLKQEHTQTQHEDWQLWLPLPLLWEDCETKKRLLTYLTKFKEDGGRGDRGIKREKSINRKQQKAAKNSETLSVAPQLSTAAHLNHITAGFSFFFWSLKVTPSKHQDCCSSQWPTLTGL